MHALTTSIRAVFLYGSAVLGSLCAVSAPALAEPFSWQLSGGVIENAYVGSFFDSRATSVDATYYLDAIDDTKGPFALASFLNPTTRISASASETSDFLDPRSYSVGGRYVWPSTGWYAGGYYSKDDRDNTAAFLENSKGFGALIGKYLGERTTLELGVGRSEVRGEQQSPLFGYTFERDADVMSLDVLHARTFRSLTYTLHGAISTRDSDEIVFQVFPTPAPMWSGASPRSRSYAVDGELFPTARLGIRVGYSTDGITSTLERDSYNLAATWFFKPRIAMQFGFTRSSLDVAIGDVDSSSVRFIGRF